MSKFLKRILCILQCLLLLAAIPVYAAAEEQEESNNAVTRIYSLDQFLAFAESCRLDGFSKDREVYLNTDIDLSDSAFTGIPIFCGTFHGNNHKITGLTLSAEGSNMGLFRYLTETAVIENLNITANISPSGSCTVIGGIVGSNEGTIRNCHFTGTVSGRDYVGGIAGINQFSGIIESCSVNGTVYGNHFVGGFSGENAGVIRDCANYSRVNITAKQNTLGISDISIESLIGSESSFTVTDVGGIAGTNNGVIRDCVNYANVGYRSMGYNIGGIAGTQSGYIVSSRNYADIQGRKEVGGIVGQMEPTALIQYEKDALQILQEQLDGMSRIVNQASTNAKAGAQQVGSEISEMANSVEDAYDAVHELIPDVEEGFPDEDTLLAAKNGLSDSLYDMGYSMMEVEATVDSTIGKLSNDLYALQSQINAMSATLGNISETVGGSVEDVSDLDTEEDFSGKVAYCKNYGSVLADINAGGIVGAMAMENDVDHTEAMDIIGNNSLNFESQVRCVLLECENHGPVTVKKQNGGGIAGWTSIGLVKTCLNYAEVDGETADYIGGIVGMSSGYIRGNSAKCIILGNSYVGGIAGSATIVTDSIGLVSLQMGNEKVGEIIGFLEKDISGEETPVQNNVYLPFQQDFGGIDGISYENKAEPMERSRFLALEQLPDDFDTVQLRFVYEDGKVRQVTIPLGSKLDSWKIPSAPKQSGYAAAWDGMDALDKENLYFDMTFRIQYTPLTTSVYCDILNDEGKAVLLMEGSFVGEDSVYANRSDQYPPLKKEETLLESFSFQITDTSVVSSIRYLIPEDCDAEALSAMVLDENQNWHVAQTQIADSYLLVHVQPGDRVVSVIETANVQWFVYLIVPSLLLVILAAFVLYRKRK